jgi:DNA polymerase elongation subunit (family B)
MKTVIFDVETTMDELAAARCGYIPSEEFAPFPLHTVVCASYLAVVSKGDGENSYTLESFSQGTMSERGIIMSLEEAVEDANVVITFNGFDFDLRVLLNRAALHELYVPRLLDLLNRSRVGKHLDLFDQLKRGASPRSVLRLPFR